MNTVSLSENFKRFSENESKDSSRLYEILSAAIAKDDDLLELSSHCSPGQPVPNLLLASVHYLLLSGVNHDLAEFYPSVTTHSRSPEEAFPPFKDFCRKHRKEIIDILKSRRVQTNEIRRCTYLYPSFCYIYDKVKTPLSIIEIGTSAGLQLLWDRYSYSFDTENTYGGTENTYGDHTSSVQLTAKLRNGHDPLLLENSPPVTSKIGIDLHVVDLSSQDERLWLKSLIWPEHTERMELFEQAAKLFRDHPVDLIEGDAVSLLPDVVEQVPDDSMLCIFHTHVANQIPESLKAKLIEHIRTIGTRRDVFHLYNNMSDIGKLHLDYFIDGIEVNEIIGETDGHGRWFDWYLNF